jgi:hypothetical protein
MTRTLPTTVYVRLAYGYYGQSPYVATFHESSTELDRVTAPEKKGLPTQYTARRLIDPRVRTQFLSQDNQWSSGENQTSINSRLLGLPGPYHRHAIGMFSNCSRGSTHQSLTDTGVGYNLGGADFPYTHSLTFLTSCLPFLLVAPPDLYFNQVLTTKPKFWVLNNIWPPHGLLTTRSSTVAYIYA